MKRTRLGCLDCHGENGRMNWQALGYKTDPLRDSSAARTKNTSL